MPNSNELTFKEALEAWIRSLKQQSKFYQTKLEAAWPGLMGPVIAKYTVSLSIYRQTLFVQLSSAPLRQELNFSKDKIIKLVNEALGDPIIKEVVIR